MIRKASIKGSDLAKLNEKKLEKWWGIKDQIQKSMIISFIQENNPTVKAFERQFNVDQSEIEVLDDEGYDSYEEELLATLMDIGSDVSLFLPSRQ